MYPPLVTCICPTRNRKSFLPLLLRSFLQQDYPYKELVIVDNGDDDSASVLKSHPDIQYVYEDSSVHRSVGWLRNRCIQQAQGEVICHFDSDDWSHPSRLTKQVEQLATYAVIAYRSILFYDVDNRLSYKYVQPDTRNGIGTSFMYRKAWAQQHPFQDIMVGEDYRFFKKAEGVSRLFEGGPHIVALIHGGQTSKKSVHSSHYHKLSAEELPREFTHDFQHHQ